MAGVLPGGKRADLCPADISELGGPKLVHKTAIESPGLAGALIAVLERGFAAIVGALFDTALMQNPEAFAVAVDPVFDQITPGTAKLLYENNGSDVPVLVRVEAEVDLAGGTASFLMLSKKAPVGAATLATSKSVSDYRVGPRCALVLPPNAKLYGDATKPGGGAGTVEVSITVIPLRGRAAVFVRG